VEKKVILQELVINNKEATKTLVATIIWRIQMMKSTGKRYWTSVGNNGDSDVHKNINNINTPIHNNNNTQKNVKKEIEQKYTNSNVDIKEDRNNRTSPTISLIEIHNDDFTNVNNDVDIYAVKRKTTGSAED
jgi:hypothetical protein